jgi:hypothetical protein
MHSLFVLLKIQVMMALTRGQPPFKRRMQSDFVLLTVAHHTRNPDGAVPPCRFERDAVAGRTIRALPHETESDEIG